MPEIIHDAKIVIVEYTCDTCGKGEMKPGGIVKMTHPPLYPHICTNCGIQQNFRERYPVSRIVKIES